MNPRNSFESTVRSVPTQTHPTQAARSQAARSQAEKLHETLLLAQATSNLGRRKFIATLLALHESKLYFQLGSPSIEHYARTHFGIERSLTFEYLRVARSLRDLDRSDEDFRVGKLSWTALREITKVATSDSEEEWIAFALKYPGARLKAEVREAVRKNRSGPRFLPDTVARCRRSWSGKEESAIRPEVCFLHSEDRIVGSDAVQGATYGAAAGGW